MSNSRVSYSQSFLFRAIFVVCCFALMGSATARTMDKRLIDIIESQIFVSDDSPPDFLNEYRTGHWSWDLTPIIKEIQSDFGDNESFIAALEDSFELSAEYLRFEEDEAANDPEKAKINRKHLDPTGSNRVRYFKYLYWRDFRSGLALDRIPTISELEAMYLNSDRRLETFMVFELQLIVYEKHEGQPGEHIEANLFWRHF